MLSAEENIDRVASLQAGLSVLTGMTVMRSDLRGGMTIVIGTEVVDQHPGQQTPPPHGDDCNFRALSTKASA